MFVFVLILCSSLSTYRLAGSMTIEKLDTGILFTKLEGPVFYSSETCTVSIRFNLSLIEQQDQNLETDFEVFHKFLEERLSNNTSVAPFLSSLSLLHGEITNFEQETEALLGLVPSDRVKRGLGDYLGRAISTMTGLLDDQQGEKISTDIVGLTNSAQKLTWEVSDNKMVVKDILSETLNNTKILGLMARDLISQGNSILEGKKLVALDQKLQELSFWVSKLRFQRSVLRLGLEGALRGQLTAELLSITKFFKILTEFADALPSPLEPLLQVSLGNMAAFYDLSTVKVVMRSTEIKVLVNVPLKRAGSAFHLFKLMSIPVFCPELYHFVKFKVQEFILVSADFKLYLPMSRDTVEHCKVSGNVTLCQVSAPLVSSFVDACEFSIVSAFPLNLCEKQVLPDGSSFFQKHGGDWMFSVASTTKVSVSCGAAPHEFKWVNGTGIFRGVGNCDLAIDNKVLLSGGTHHSRTIFEGWSDFSIPARDKGNLLTAREKDEVQRAQLEGDIVAKINASMASAKRALNLQDIFEGWSVERSLKPMFPAHWQLHSTSGVVVILVMVIVVLLYKHLQLVARNDRPFVRGSV